MRARSAAIPAMTARAWSPNTAAASNAANACA